MKTITLTQVTAALKYSLTALVATIALVGCGKSSTNNVNPYNNGFIAPGICTQGCINGGSVNVSAFGQNRYSGVQIQVQFFGQGSQNYGSSNGAYYGPVAVQGQVMVQSDLYSVCGVYRGQALQITTIQQGQWSGTSIFENIHVQLSNGMTGTMSGWTSTSATSGNMYGLNATIRPMQNPNCEIVVAP